MREIEDFITYMPECSLSNKMQVYLYFKVNAPKSIPNNVKFLLETAFNLEERGISCAENGSDEDVETISKLYDRLREYVLSKHFEPYDCGDWDGRVQSVCRVFLLALIRVIGYSYADL